MASFTSALHIAFPLLFIFTLTPALFSPCLSHDNLHFYFPYFNSNDRSLNFSDFSNIDNQAIQVTPNSATRDVSNTSGQATHVQPLQLWHRSYNYSASFNTSFLLNIAPIPGGTLATGGGITFMLSSIRAIRRLPNSFGQWLGLFDGNATEQEAQIVAIEFDTFKDSFEKDGNHVGIDVNGTVNSIRVEPLSPQQVFLTNTSTSSGINTSVWIDYDGQIRTLDVYLANHGATMGTKPVKPIISLHSFNLSMYLPEYVYVGFSASLGTILETHCVLQWNFTSTDFPSDNNNTFPPVRVKTPNINAIIIACTIGGAAVALLLIFLVIFLVRKRKRKRSTIVMDDLNSLHYGPQKFTYRELKKATNGFSKESNLGQGGFGVVYKGVLRSNNDIKEVAVKCLSQKSKQGEREFKAEVMSIGRMRHKNLVQLLGWSYERSKLMLVYEYMPKLSLNKWIRQGQEEVEVMGWETRFHVMKGLAAGLLYLHEEWEMVVVHRDLKPSNVMLDADFNARIGDFGLAKLLNMEQEQSAHITAHIVGTPGYIAPECVKGIIGKEADIYSLGAIAIELVTGHGPFSNCLHSLALLLEDSRSQEVADPRLPSFDPTQLELLLKLGLACCHPHPSGRPSIRDVVHALSSSSSSSTMDAPSPTSFSTIYAAAHSVQISSSSQLVAFEISGGR